MTRDEATEMVRAYGAAIKAGRTGDAALYGIDIVEALMRASQLTVEERIAACGASHGGDTFYTHTCRLETVMYFQGNMHRHGGSSCVDWSHCTRQSDEQWEMT
jgi:hypothetical protein